MTAATRAFFLISLTALVGAAALHGLVLLGQLAVWSAMIHLALFGWATGMVFGVTYHTMPVFTAKNFPYRALIQAHVGLWAGGLVASSAALLLQAGAPLVVGLLLELGATSLFAANILLLFLRGPRRTQRPPMPLIAIQPQVDAIGVQATKGAVVSLPLSLVLLVLTQLGWSSGSWWLAAEHLCTVGWLLLMVVGVAYHVLPRFSNTSIRSVGWAHAQLVAHYIALLLMVPSLGFGWSRLFAAGGTLMAAAIALFVWAIWPTVQPLRVRLIPIQAIWKGDLP